MVLKERLTLVIQSLAFGGDSVARTSEGFVLFIPGGVPGDQVEIEITELKKKFGTAQIVKMVVPSPDRRVAPCPVFGICGGCQWQHIRYESQLKFKSEMVSGALLKSGIEPKSLEPVVPSPCEFNYRNRIQVRTQNGKIGFYQRGSHAIAPIESCPIAMDEINLALKKVVRRPDRKVELQLLKSGNVVTDENAEHGENLGFSQVNDFGNQRMIQAISAQVAAWNHDQSIRRVWDLYAGDGNFTWPLATVCAAASIQAVEFNRNSVERANLNVEEMAPGRNIKFFHARVEDWLKLRLKNSASGPADLVLLDPPRMGCAPEVTDYLLKLKPKKVIFIGCDLSHFTRDVRPLLKEYTLVKVIPFDLFPQTYHIETVAFFELNTSRKVEA